MEELKLYRVQIQIRVLEYEFYIEKLIQAPTWGDAMQIAQDFCKDYYGDGKEDGDNEESISYVFNGGCPVVTVMILEVMGKERWLEMMYDRALIKN